MRRLLIVVVAVAISGCGGAAKPASVVPADAALYVSVADGEPAERLLDLLGMRALEYEDVRPWIGDRAAFFATRDERGALVLSIRDEDAAREWAERKAGINELSFWDIVDGQLVLASSKQALNLVRKTADNDRSLKDRIDEGEDAPPAVLMARDQRAAAGAVRWFRRLPLGSEGIALDILPEEGTVTARAWLRDDELRLDVTGLGPPRPAPPPLEDLTGAAWLAYATPDLGPDVMTAAGIGFTGPELYTAAELATGLDLEDVLTKLGPATLLVQGRTQNNFSAQLQVALRDEEAIRAATIAAARALPGKADVFRNEEIVNFFSPLRDPLGTGVIDSVVAHVENERLVVRSGVQVGGTDEYLGETAAFRDAQRRLGGPPTLFVKLAPAAKLLGLPAQDKGAYLAATERTVDGKRFNRFVLVRP